MYIFFLIFIEHNCSSFPWLSIESFLLRRIIQKKCKYPKLSTSKFLETSIKVLTDGDSRPWDFIGRVISLVPPRSITHPPVLHSRKQRS